MTTYDLVILNGRVMDPETRLDAVRNVCIQNGRIEVVIAGHAALPAALHAELTGRGKGAGDLRQAPEVHPDSGDPRAYPKSMETGNGDEMVRRDSPRYLRAAAKMLAGK